MWLTTAWTSLPHAAALVPWNPVRHEQQPGDLDTRQPPERAVGVPG
jgi:hypothetical protein